MQGARKRVGQAVGGEHSICAFVDLIFWGRGVISFLLFLRGAFCAGEMYKCVVLQVRCFSVYIVSFHKHGEIRTQDENTRSTRTQETKVSLLI